jgi:hypothetical protein
MSNRTQPEITLNTPLRLADAVKIAFPMGGMTVAVCDVSAIATD